MPKRSRGAAEAPADPPPAPTLALALPRTTHEQVRDRAAEGATEELIAIELGLELAELQQEYRRDLDAGIAKANSAVIEAAHRMACAGDRPAVTIFWLKARAGWNEQGRKGRDAEADELVVFRALDATGALREEAAHGNTHADGGPDGPEADADAGSFPAE